MEYTDFRSDNPVVGRLLKKLLTSSLKHYFKNIQNLRVLSFHQLICNKGHGQSPKKSV